jgi:hypothetical protein
MENTDSILAQEDTTYTRLLPGLLKTDEGKFALIHGDALEGTFYDFRDALAEGYRKFKEAPFMVRKVERFREILNFSNNFRLA